MLLFDYSASDDFTADDRPFFAHEVDWTPETGFSPELPSIAAEHFYPRPGVGNRVLVKLVVCRRMSFVFLHQGLEVIWD